VLQAEHKADQTSEEEDLGSPERPVNFVQIMGAYWVIITVITIISVLVVSTSRGITNM
jgi:hypothetical protein